MKKQFSSIYQMLLLHFYGYIYFTLFEDFITICIYTRRRNATLLISAQLPQYFLLFGNSESNLEDRIGDLWGSNSYPVET